MFKFIKTSSVGLRETFGRFTKVLEPGLNFYIPFVQRVHVMSVNTHTQHYRIAVKTKDNVFANFGVAVSTSISDPVKAAYSHSHPMAQLEAALEDVIRSNAPLMDLDRLFESKDDIQKKVNEMLTENMEQYGYKIENVMVTEIDPAPKVREAMNQINAAKRLKEATEYEAEAHKIRIIREAEADAERKHLNGKGIALMRLAVIKGYEEGISDLAKKLNVTSKEAMEMTMLTQYFDSIEKIGQSPNTKTIFVPTSPGSAVADFRRSIMEADEATKEKIDHL